MDEAFDDIDPIFYKNDFNATKYLLRFLMISDSSSTAENTTQDEEVEFNPAQLAKLQQIKRYEDKIQKKILTAIDENYAAFNNSVQKFAQIQQNFDAMQKQLDNIHTQTFTAKSLLSAKVDNLDFLLEKKYEAEQGLKYVCEVEEIRNSPQKFNALLENEKYVEAVTYLNGTLSLMFCDSMLNLDVVGDIRNVLMEAKQDLEGQLLFKLQNTLYIKTFLADLPESICTIDEIYESFKPYAFKSNQLFDSNISTNDDSNVGNSFMELMQALYTLRKDIDIKLLKNSLLAEFKKIIRDTSSFCIKKIKIFTLGRMKGRNPKSIFHCLVDSDFSKVTAFMELVLFLLDNVYKRHYVLWKIFQNVHDPILEFPFEMEDVTNALHQALQELLTSILTDSVKALSLNTDLKDGTKKICSFKFKRNTNGLKKNADEESHKFVRKKSVICSPIFTEDDPLICSPNPYYLPKLYSTVMRFLKQECFVYKSVNENSANVENFISTFIKHVWVPIIYKDLDRIYGSFVNNSSFVSTIHFTHSEINVPPSEDGLLVASSEICSYIQRLPRYGLEFVPILETAVSRWTGKCSTIMRDIITKSFCEQQLFNSSKDLRCMFVDYEVFQSINQNSIKKLKSSETVPISRDEFLSYELETENDLFCGSFWKCSDGPPKILLFDLRKIYTLAFINKKCSFVYQNLNLQFDSLQHNLGKETLSNLTAICDRSNSLADECLFFLRKEIRLHCFFFLTKMVFYDFDIKDNSGGLFPHDYVTYWNEHLSSIANMLQNTISLSKEKILFIFHGLEILIPIIFIRNLSEMQGKFISNIGVSQIIVNLNALKQKLSCVFYSYHDELFLSNFNEFGNAMRYYQLLLITESQLEDVLRNCGGKLSSNYLHAIWLINTESRTSTSDSIAKFERIISG